MSIRRIVRATAPTLAVLAATAFASACADERGPLLPPAVVSVAISVPAGTTYAGDTVQLHATIKGPDGTLLRDRAVIWASSNETVATVSASGVLTTHRSGMTVITATSEGRTGQASIAVQLRVGTLEVNFGRDRMVLGHGRTGPVLAVLQGTDGSQMAAFPDHPNGRTIRWTSSDTLIASMGNDGFIESRFPGVVTLTAEVDGIIGQLRVEVLTPVRQVVLSMPEQGLEVGQTYPMSAVIDSWANPPTPWSIQWDSDHPRVLTVDARGVVTARKPGMTTIRATVEGVVGSRTVWVNGDVLHALDSVADAPLPAPLYTSVEVHDGIARYRTTSATGGTLRFHRDRHHYTMVLELSVHEGNQVVETPRFVDEGELLYRWNTGQLVFNSTTRPGLQYDVDHVYAGGYLTGEVVVHHRIAGGDQTVPLRFGSP
jgi:uncharacterized protein YjdB